MTVQRILVVGGGSAGFLAAITLKARLPRLAVCVVRSPEIGIIGVGEGSTAFLPAHLHGYLGIDFREFYELAEPQWKLGIRFLWGRRPFFDYTFDRQFTARYRGLSKSAAHYVPYGDTPVEWASVDSALMSLNKPFVRGQEGSLRITDTVAYHLENETFVRFLDDYARRLGVEIVEDTIVEVMQNEAGVAGLRLKSGETRSAELYVDCSGFQSLLLSRSLHEPFVSFKSSLFCDRAVVGGWARTDEPIKPYTTAETMNAGWCWQIEHERRINRGYVHSSAFISDEEAEREFRTKNPRVEATRVVRFVSGRYERSWVKNVVAIGNASGFVEPLESTSLSFICTESINLAEGLADADMQIRPTVTALFNQRIGRGWDTIRRFLSLHYKFNDRLDTPFWQECREKTDLAGAETLVDFYAENGPSDLWQKVLLDPDDQFTMEGYLSMLIGQQAPCRAKPSISDADRLSWSQYQTHFKHAAANAPTLREALAEVRSPGFAWPTNRYLKLCKPAPPRQSSRGYEFSHFPVGN